MSDYIDWSVKAKGVVGAPLQLDKQQRIQHEHEITCEMIEQGYKTAAGLVKHHGEEYLPIFERLCYEREKRMKSNALLEQAFVVAG